MQDGVASNHLCPECGKGFTKRSKLVVHVRRHTGEKPFLCEECGKGFTNGYALTCHKKIHSGEKPHTCNICNRSFTDKCTLKRHILRHIGEKNYVCKICNKGYTTDSALATHVKWHSAENSFFCDVCGKSFLLRSALNKHVSTVHLKSKPHACLVCEKRFAHRYNLVDHLKTHDKPYTCTICNKTFTFEKYLVKHLERHRSKSSTNTVSGEEFPIEKKVETKVEDSVDHDEIDPCQEQHVCKVCDKKLKSKGFLLRHLKTHEPKSFKCPLCHKSFPSQSRVKVHTERFHGSIQSVDYNSDVSSLEDAIYIKEEPSWKSAESVPVKREAAELDGKVYQEPEWLEVKEEEKQSPKGDTDIDPLI